jgi:hypothetical protein
MPSLVVDTNVFATADGLNGTASARCVDACVEIALQIDRGTRLVVDESGEILAEYLATLNARRASGVAAKLIRRLHDQRHVGSCDTVPITRAAAPPPVYDEVPPALADFDYDDQKFIAVAATAGATAFLVAGLDREWFDRQADFAASGLPLQFPCLTDLLGP